MIITKILEHQVGRIVISIILGLGLASLFRRVCLGANCIIIKGPPLKDVNGKIFSFNDKCYQYKSKITGCSNKNKMDLDKIGANNLQDV